MRREWSREAGMLGASLVGAFALARLATGATTATLATATLGTVVVALLHRRATLAIVLGVMTVAASAFLWGLLATSHSGSSAIPILQALRHSLHAARPILVTFHLPLVHSPGIIALCALFGGLVAVAGRTLGTSSPALSLVPAAILLVWSAILFPTAGVALAGLALGFSGFLVFGKLGRQDRRTSAVVAGISLGLAAVTLGWSAVAGSNVASAGGEEAAGVAPSALSLATDLTGVEVRDANVVLFQSNTRVETYWQVATLTSYVGHLWVPDPATTALLHRSVPNRSPTASTNQRLYTAGVTLSGYSGRLLPVPPSTVAGSGELSPVVTPSGVVATLPVHAGSSYTVTAVIPSPVVDSPSTPASTGTYTALGAIPAIVTSLARSITGGQTTTLGKAEALTDFFRSGRFHYKVTATQPVGVDPLVAFLSQTRTGSCEQFAGAFAVLARASGLSTRVAIGFTPGRLINGVTVVRGSDAHAWPQVLIGGGWVSFEPTPQLPSGELSPPGILGPAGLGQSNPTGPGPEAHVSIPAVTAPTPTIPPSTVPTPVASTTDLSIGILGIVLLLLATIVTSILILRRRTRRMPIDRVIAAWTDIDRALAKRGFARPVWRTPIGHIHALSGLRLSEQSRAALVDLERIATLLQNVTYGSSDVSSADFEQAVEAGRRARRAILAGALFVSGNDDLGAEHQNHEFTGSSGY